MTACGSPLASDMRTKSSSYQKRSR